MQAIVQRDYGGPEVLVLEDVLEPDPAAGQVRIAVSAAGVHLLDATLREGVAGPFGRAALPMTPGREVAGVVDAVGPDVEGSWLGRRVVAHLGVLSGGYAARALAPAAALIPLAEHVDEAEAVAMVGTGRTALGILEEAAIGPDDTVLVTSAAGGLGTLLVQAGVQAGARVVGVAGGAAKSALVASYGAHPVDYLEPGWPAEVAALLGAERPVTVALDGVGGTVGRAAFDLVAPGGRLVMFGWTAGEAIALSAQDVFERGVAVTAAIGARMFARPDGIQGLAREAVDRLAADEWRPATTRFPLAEAAEAHRALSERRTTGKVVLLT
ncbi:zinc-binding dehydrogenase [Nocardioides sp. zg-1228]|uniref:zinc-binding dehydrogenase n=1 Tax=Nocardioides sp. zg-1228 TaxID=2763008 RepID=UPI0016428A28|nr:zinc-binding dehydrogenase [Nocardioides sp. zg-1228]MBC2934320.1 zinc-binding dehydrogenase [Nocardioides sp. zg-1228]QSF59099.1 zinc-binding dehydrogenase [Nocardioides sp. zg-1228]